MYVQQRYRGDARGSGGEEAISSGSAVEDLNRHLDGYLQELYRVSADSSTLGHTRGDMYQRRDRLHQHPGASAGQGSGVMSS